MILLAAFAAPALFTICVLVAFATGMPNVSALGSGNGSFGTAAAAILLIFILELVLL